MKSVSAWIIFCFLALFISCVPTKPVNHEVNFDYDVNVDFSRLKTYDWVSMPGTSRIDQFNRIRVQDVANIELNAKGLKMAPNNPDMFVVMYGGQTKAFDMTAMMDYEVYAVGRIKLAFYNAKTNDEIWYGETRADLFHHLTPEEKDKVIALAVHKILAKYPPKP
jgi:hypothetical protein